MSATLTVTARHGGGMLVETESRGHHVTVDYPLPGPETAGMTSLELLLAAFASCAVNTLAFALRRLGESFDGLSAAVTAERATTHPTVLTTILLELVLTGDVDPDVARQALVLSEEQFCPVWAMLKPGTPIRASVRVEAA